MESIWKLFRSLFQRKEDILVSLPGMDRFMPCKRKGGKTVLLHLLVNYNTEKASRLNDDRTIKKTVLGFAALVNVTVSARNYVVHYYIFIMQLFLHTLLLGCSPRGTLLYLVQHRFQKTGCSAKCK